MQAGTQHPCHAFCTMCGHEEGNMPQVSYRTRQKNLCHCKPMRIRQARRGVDGYRQLARSRIVRHTSWICCFCGSSESVASRALVLVLASRFTDRGSRFDTCGSRGLKSVVAGMRPKGSDDILEVRTLEHATLWISRALSTPVRLTHPV